MDLLQNPHKSSTSVHRRHSLKFEECLVHGEKIKLPQALCENTELFQALFSVDSWNAFTETQRRHLMQFLPNFGENDSEEKSCTLKQLFSGDEFCFGSNPLIEFCDKLNGGFYRTDIVNMQTLLIKARYKEYLKKQRVYYYKILKHCLIMRHKLLESASDLSLGSVLPSLPNNSSSSNTKRKIECISLEKRVKHRYFQELISIKKEIDDSSDSSYDENYPEGFIPPPFTKKHRRQMSVLEDSFNYEFEQPIISTLSRPDSLDLSRLVLNLDNPFEMTEDKYKELRKQYHKHNRNLHPYLKVQKKNNNPPITKKEGKPIRKRRPRKPAAAPKQASQELSETIKTEPSSSTLSDSFSNKTISNNSFFVNTDSLGTYNCIENKFDPLENEFNSKFNPLSGKYDKIRLNQDFDSFVSCGSTSSNEQNLSIKKEPSSITIRNGITMKEEQDNAVAALLKQEEEEAKVNAYINNEEEKNSVLLFDEFNHHHTDVNRDKNSTDFLLTPESYNVALQSVVVNDGPAFNNRNNRNEEKTITVVTEPTNITEVENLPFGPLSLDPIAVTSFTNSPSVISTSGIVPLNSRISPSVTDLDNMNVMDLGHTHVEEPDPLLSREKPPSELMHNAHACFFSLIREIVCSTWDHRMDLRNLHERVDTWYDNAVSPLNSWYTNESWPSLLQNAVTFLAGHCPEDLLPPEYVPYMEYKLNLDIYQWIGAGRDSDTKLSLLCVTWLKYKRDIAARVIDDESILPFVLNDELEVRKEQRSVSPACSRYPTDWVVRPSTREEEIDFRKQEKLRFQKPTVSFTYHIHGYQTVVGPVNTDHSLPNNSKITKGSSLLVEKRPPFVTVLALIQDAAARLPNGEGTRHDIVTLLKDSQYLSKNIINCMLHGVVTSALERLQLETDACVKYDARRKLWIYLHRSRTISDFEMIESVKPKQSRKTPVWKLKKEYIPIPNVTPFKSDVHINDTSSAVRSVKEVKTGARTTKNTNAGKANELKNVTKRTVAQRKDDKIANKLQQASIIQAVIQDVVQNVDGIVTTEPSKTVTTLTTNAVEKIAAVADMKNIGKPIMKMTRPSIIKKAIIKDAIPISTASATIVKSNISDPKSILTSSSILSPNTIVKLINAKSLTTTGAVKGAKTLAQISPQQIVVIKQSEDGLTGDKKRTVLLKQLQQHTPYQPRLSIATTTSNTVQRTQRSSQTDQSSLLALNTDIRKCSIIDNRNTNNDVKMVATNNSIAGNVHKQQDLLEKHQKQLQQLMLKQQNELKLQQQTVADAGKDQQPQQQLANVIQSSKNLPKQMIVMKHDQGQIVAETQSLLDEMTVASLPNQKPVTSPLVILNKQRYQQQLQNSKPQVILSGQQMTQQIQQLLLKQQQNSKRNNQQQQIVMLKPDMQQSGQQIVMLKPQSQQQQLVMIKPTMQQTQKMQHKQSQPQIIQISNSAGIVTPISADITKLQAAISSAATTRIQKLQTSVTPTIIQNAKSTSGIISGTTISLAINKPSMPTYTVVALGQQQKVLSQNNQNVQILTSTSNTVGSNQTVMLPTTSGTSLTLLQQAPVQQVLLPSAFNAQGMINFKTLQGLKVIPISAQNTSALRGQPVITRIVNSNTIRPVVIQEDINPTTSSSSSNLPHQ